MALAIDRVDLLLVWRARGDRGPVRRCPTFEGAGTVPAIWPCTESAQPLRSMDTYAVARRRSRSVGVIRKATVDARDRVAQRPGEAVHDRSHLPATSIPPGSPTRGDFLMHPSGASRED